MARKHRNPSFPTGIVVGAVLGAGALAWWLTRKPATSATQALNYNGLPHLNGLPVGGIEPNREYLGDGSMSYADTSHPLYNPPQGSGARPLTPAEIAAIEASQFRAPLLPAEVAMIAQQRAALAGGRTLEAEYAATIRNGGTPGMLT